MSSISGNNSGNGYVSITYTGSASRSFVYREIAQNFTVPTTGVYRISVDGASGGTCGYSTPGNGAHIQGEFALTKGQTISLLIGGQGGNVSAYSGSGGGGRWRSFVCI
ncbi:MAG: glycine-rich protein [Clostridia bacterium]|nr:glycine-rich protein [Clostridia bacterium]